MWKVSSIIAQLTYVSVYGSMERSEMGGVCALNNFIPFVHFLQLMDDIGCIIVQDS